MPWQRTALCHCAENKGRCRVIVLFVLQENNDNPSAIFSWTEQNARRLLPIKSSAVHCMVPCCVSFSFSSGRYSSSIDSVRTTHDGFLWTDRECPPSLLLSKDCSGDTDAFLFFWKTTTISISMPPFIFLRRIYRLKISPGEIPRQSTPSSSSSFWKTDEKQSYRWLDFHSQGGRMFDLVTYSPRRVAVVFLCFRIGTRAVVILLIFPPWQITTKIIPSSLYSGWVRRYVVTTGTTSGLALVPLENFPSNPPMLSVHGRDKWIFSKNTHTPAHKRFW